MFVELQFGVWEEFVRNCAHFQPPSQLRSKRRMKFQPALREASAIQAMLFSAWCAYFGHRQRFYSRAVSIPMVVKFINAIALFALSQSKTSA